MTSNHDLERYVTAQNHVIDQVRDELRRGAKRTHWMWFVFPQIAGLGSSARAQRYAIASLDEAAGFLAHPVLGRRLVECTGLVLAVQGRSLHDILGSPDDVKFHSCVTLFEAVPMADPIFGEALQKFFGGRRDQATLDRL